MFWNKKKNVEAQKGPALACMHYGICSKEKCPMWIQFDSTIIVEGKKQEVKESRCTFAWMPTLMVELRHHLTVALKEGKRDATS